MTVPGISDYNSFPCVKNTVPYDEVVQVLFPDSVSQFGFNVTVLNVRIDSITNLPCGLCWQCDNASLTYAGGTKACIKISGTPTDVEGAYQIKMYGTASTSFGPLAGSLETLGFQFFLNVVGATDACTPVNIQQLKTSCQVVDTSTTAHQCDLDIQLSSSTPVTNCNFDSAVITVAHPTGAGYKVYWESMDFLTFTMTVDSVNSSLTVKPGSTFYSVTVRDSSGCVDHESILTSNAGPANTPRICYATYDSTGNDNSLTLLYQKDDWFNNMATYKVYHQTLANTSGVLLATIPAANDGYVVDPSPLTFSELNSNVVNTYSMQSTTICGDELGSSLFRPNVLSTTTTGAGYPMLVWTKSEPIVYDATYIFSRHVGGNWRIRFSTMSINDTSWIDLTPDTVQMEYMLGFLLNVNCDPSRSAPNMAFSSKGNVAVNPSLVVPDTTVNTSVTDLQTTMGIIAYPNPASNYLMVQCNVAGSDGDLDLKIYDVMGRKVMVRKVTSVISTLDVSELTTGVYTVNVSSAGKSAATLRFVKN
ncbi:MAG TPA: T9SS type A sorting domain-containing protein [Chitinophagales bacterium]|nr:T9SS type A sorting domain-containing protein [Chitinophagales bacterium]